MNQWKFETGDTIRMILGENMEIVHSNLNYKASIKHLEGLGILDDLFINMPPQSCFKNEKVIIDKFILDGKPYYLITSTKRYECSSCIKVLRDEMTGLYNRNYWEFIKNKTLPINTEKYLSLILIDVDNLKQINDVYGHIAGDKVIRIVGQAIKNSIRKEDLGIRYGGDEFIILLFNQHKKAAKRVTERVRREIRKLAVEQGMNIQISVGIACTDCLVDLEDMIKMADKNLYREKEKKKEQKGQNNKVNNLAKEIREIRDELNRKIDRKSKIFTSTEILELSQKLDKLIVNYLEKE